MTRRMDPNLYRYVECALRNHADECERKKLLEEYLAAPVGPEAVERVQGGESTAEQDRIVDRKMRSDELRGLTHKTACIESFLNVLGENDRAFVELRYFQGLSWSIVADRVHAAEETCRKRWAPRLIKRAAWLLFGDLAEA